MSPHTGRGTHTRLKQWKEGGKECLPYVRKASPCYATIHKHVQLRHMHIYVNTADLQGNASALCCNSVTYI